MFFGGGSKVKDTIAYLLVCVFACRRTIIGDGGFNIDEQDGDVAFVDCDRNDEDHGVSGGARDALS